MLVTVATPTYNRSHLLPRLYKSLCCQTCADFEWLVVDDGSTDDTGHLLESLINEGTICIRYIRKQNGGKHTAVNLAAQEARGELLFIADSDDWLPPTSIADVIEMYDTIKGDDSFAGVCGLDEYAHGHLVGSGLTKSVIDASSQDIREKWGVTGDLKEVFRTDLLREYPFPEIPGERFCPEVLVWNRIGQKYKLRYFNKPIYTVEYQTDGLTSAITRARMKSPVATMTTYSEWFRMAKSLTTKLHMAINYWRFAFCAPFRNRVSISGWANLLLPIGLIFYFKDKISVK